ncbi:hypothetical protein FRB91_002334 [Serendipita sp. 411]|nr:hypothetical protein FRB91_002334 [Serendipita sp. 411]
MYSREFWRCPLRTKTTMAFRIQILSDIHLEMERGDAPLYEYDLPATAPNLALLGDIGWTREPRLFEWLDIQRRRFEITFFLSGNHEPYFSSLAESDNRLKEYASKCEQESLENGTGRFVYLDRTRYDVSPGLTILGCTLWAKLDPNELDILSFSVTDFKRIESFGPNEFSSAHAADVAWLRESINRIRQSEPSRRVIVFTHHAPTVDGVSDPKYIGGLTSSAFVTEFSDDEIIWSKPVIAWAFGHTHWSCDFERNAVRVYSNQRGYKESPRYDPTRVVEFET